MLDCIISIASSQKAYVPDLGIWWTICAILSMCSRANIPGLQCLVFIYASMARIRTPRMDCIIWSPLVSLRHKSSVRMIWRPYFQRYIIQRLTCVQRRLSQGYLLCGRKNSVVSHVVTRWAVLFHVGSGVPTGGFLYILDYMLTGQFQYHLMSETQTRELVTECWSFGWVCKAIIALVTGEGYKRRRCKKHKLNANRQPECTSAGSLKSRCAVAI